MTQWRRVPAAFAIGVLLWTAGGVANLIGQSAAADLTREIRDSVHGSSASARLLTAPTRSELTALYEAGAYQPLWVDRSGRPTGDARGALALLTGAAGDGLVPADYRASFVDESARTLDATPAPSIASVASFDTALSAGLLRYLRDLHIGRVNPRAIGFRMTIPADDHDFPSLLRAALDTRRIPELAAQLAPPLALYRNLRTQLARYRALAADPRLQGAPLPDRVVRPGDAYDDADALRQQLVALGDLPADTSISPTALYEGALVGGVRRFQTRHGLDADGIIGARTRAALAVPLASRVRQIELALERLRWLPHLDPDRFLAVNIPMFRLWGWDAAPRDGGPSFGMNVIVGRALNTQTPVFVAELEHLIFRPYWNVPASIARGEIVPAIERDPGYLQQHDMEIVSGDGDDARVVPLSDDSLALLRQGRLRVRQRPGPRNSLGLVKFIFPNDLNVYLHDTPAHQLFSRPRRDFSHGCVRVEDPVALAEWALTGQAGWDRDRILAAMNGSQSTLVNLDRPIQVILFYITAVVMPEDGSIHFAEDIYRHDTRLHGALTKP